MTVKPPRHAAYKAMLAERREERWAGAYCSSRKKKTPYKRQLIYFTGHSLWL